MHVYNQLKLYTGIQNNKGKGRLVLVLQNFIKKKRDGATSACLLTPHFLCKNDLKLNKNNELQKMKRIRPSFLEPSKSMQKLKLICSRIHKWHLNKNQYHRGKPCCSEHFLLFTRNSEQ